MIRILFITVLMGCTIAGWSQTTKSRKQLKAEKLEAGYVEMKALADSAYFVFEAQKANPQSMPQVDLTTHTAFLKLISDSVSVYLPYYGRTYNPTYGGDGGIKANKKALNLTRVNNDEKRKIILKFKIEGIPDSYDVMLEIQATGSAYLVVNSNKFATISYFGAVKYIDK